MPLIGIAQSNTPGPVEEIEKLADTLCFLDRYIASKKGVALIEEREKVKDALHEEVKSLSYTREAVGKELFDKSDSASLEAGIRPVVVGISKYLHSKCPEATVDTLSSAIDRLLMMGDRKLHNEENMRNLRRYSGSERYDGIPYMTLDALLKEVGRLTDLKESVFYDIGSCDGRAVLYAAVAYGLKRAVGIEIAPWRVDYCNRVKGKLGLVNAEFENIDAREADYSNGDIFLLVDPFPPYNGALETVCGRLKPLRGKYVVVVAATPEFWHHFEREEWLEAVYSSRKKEGRTSMKNFAIYRVK